MANVSVNGNGSQFYISFGENSQLNGLCPVFGRVIGGQDILDKLEKSFTVGGKPATEIVVVDCGVVEASTA